MRGRADVELSLGILGREPFRRHLEMLEQESRRDGAADKRICTQRLRALPRARRHDDLRVLSLREIAAEHEILHDAILRDAERKRRTRIPMPDLGSVYPVPVRTLVRLQE